MPHKCRWTPEIIAWLKSLYPAQDHGYKNRREVWLDMNRRFNTSIPYRSFVTHLSSKKIWLGYATTNDNTTDKHYIVRPVGALQIKKDYVRIKVAQPNKWIAYSRYIWEKAHPGQCGEGLRFIFLDGNKRNFEPTNIEAVTPREQAIMAQLECKSSDSREVREIKLLQARLKIAMIDIYGYEKSAKIVKDLHYQAIKDNPEFKKNRHDYYIKRMEELKKDPEKYKEHIRKSNSSRKKKKKTESGLTA